MDSQKTGATIYRRADSPQQKKDRRLMILKAATEELEQLHSVDDFTIDSLARRLGLSRGTIYLYFKDRDAIFLVLLVDATNSFLMEIARTVSSLSAPVTSRTVARAFCDVLKGNNRLRHFPQLLKSLSKNSDKKTKSVEKEIESCRREADEVIVRQLNGLQPGDGRQIIHYGWPLLLGFSEIIYSSTKTTISEYVLKQVEDGMTLIIEGLLARSRMP